MSRSDQQGTTMCLGEIGRVTALSDGRAEVSCQSRVITVSTLMLDEEVAVGDWLLVHSGLGLARLDPADALAALEARAAPEARTLGGH